MKRGHLLAPLFVFAPFFSGREVKALTAPIILAERGEIWRQAESPNSPSLLKLNNPQLFQ